MSEVFADYKHLPEEARKHLTALEDMLGELEGKTLCSDGTSDDNGQPTFIDEGTIVADDYVAVFNGLIAELTRLQQANAALAESGNKLIEHFFPENVQRGFRTIDVEKLKAFKTALAKV